MSETGHIGVNVAIWGGVVAGALALLVAFGPHWAVWAACIVASALWLFAILGLSDGPSRAFLAGTLRKSSYTQIYTALTRRNVMWLWRRLCDEAGDRDSWPTLFRAALTWRLYDTALLLAVAYPLLLLVGQWIVTGAEGRLGSLVVLPAAALWPDRVAMMGAFVVLILGFVGRPPAADWLPRLAFLLAVAVSLAGLVGVALAGDGAVALSPLVAVMVAGLLILRVRGALAIAGAVMVSVIFATNTFTGAFAVMVAILGAAAIESLDTRGMPVPARWMVTGAVVLPVTVSAGFLDWSAIPTDGRSVFLFLAVFPLLNALFDVLSCAVTLSLLRRGLRAHWPFVWGLLDLVLACVLFLALGATLVAAIHGLNWLAGVPLLDLDALLAGVRHTPGAHVWLYLMLFSTILPTALHFGVSLLGLQGVWPRRLRRPVARWIERAPDSPLHAVRAGVALGLVWTVPLFLLGAALWELWAFAGRAALDFLGAYLDLVQRIAHVPLGAV